MVTVWLGRVVRFPLTRIVLGAACIIGAIAVTQALAGWLHELLGFGPLRVGSLQHALPVILAVHVTYAGYVRVMERRSAAELSGDGALCESGAGALVGFTLLAVSIAAIAALGYYHVDAVNPWTTVIPPFAAALLAAWWEELLFRGLLFRITEQSLGTWLALGVSAAVFGLAHVSTPGWTLLGLLAIAVEAGMLLGSAYVLTRRLWLPIGIHFGWNFANGFFGVSTVGREGLFEARLSGPYLISGDGDVGQSVLAVLLVSAVSAVVLIKAHRAGQFTRPFWRREPVS